MQSWRIIMSIKEETEKAYREAIDELTKIQTNPLGTKEQAKEAERAIDELNLANLNEILDSFEERTAKLNGLVQTLNRISANINLDPTRMIKDSIGKIVDKGRELLLKVSKEVMPGDGPATPDAVEPDDDTLAEPSPDKTEMHESEEIDEDPPERRNLPKISSTTLGTPSSRVPNKLKEDYERLFASCNIRPDKLAKVNWHISEMEKNRDKYISIGDELGIPWWFIGAIHAMEAGYRLDSHLHNGDPLSDRTKRVPAGRPLDSDPPFSWDDSARDALIYMNFDQWNDWSVAGSLYKWERYNGFGYRKYHPEVLSPYLWSYTNHYSKGKYVTDGSFNSEAISRQCGTATVLRVLINTGIAIL